jgi:hypothetical protein
MRFDEYFALAEEHSWRVTELDWGALQSDIEAGLVSDFDREAVLGTAVIEHGVPHYGEVWSLVEGLRDQWELWQFTSLWTGEEHRHSFALKKAAEALGIAPRIADDLEVVSHFDFATRQKQSCPLDCYRTVPGMLTYAVIQELATHKFYAMAAKRSESPFLKKLFGLIGGDEMRHHCFYRDALRDGHAAAADPAWYSEQVRVAAQSFKMPHLIYNLQMAFFESGGFAIGADIMPQLARCFSFDMGLLAKLAAANPVVIPAERAPAAPAA